MIRACLYLSILGCLISPVPGWSQQALPSYLIRVPESVTTVFVAETATAEFHRYDHADGILKHGGSHTMSIGEAGVGKQKSGDKRTPLGVYFVTERLDTSRLHEKYGIAAFVLDYPNAWDQRLERTGHGIWVHGVDPRGGTRPARDTDGCIALANADLASLAEVFQDNITPVLIANEIESIDEAARELLATQLQTVLDRWADSLASGDLHAYLSSYDDRFERWGMRHSEWASLSQKFFAERVITGVAIDDVLLLGYPEAHGVYVSRFRQTITEGGKRTVSMKRLYWRRGIDGALRIIVEDSG
jgi:hypothetical protein